MYHPIILCLFASVTNYHKSCHFYSPIICYVVPSLIFFVTIQPLNQTNIPLPLLLLLIVVVHVYESVTTQNVIDDRGNIHVSFIMSKTNVAPIKRSINNSCVSVRQHYNNYTHLLCIVASIMDKISLID